MIDVVTDWSYALVGFLGVFRWCRGTVLSKCSKQELEEKIMCALEASLGLVMVSTVDSDADVAMALTTPIK